MKFTDILTLDGAIRRTTDGYGVVSAKVARGGNVQTYLGSELGVEDKAIVRVYRPETEVFKKDAIASYAGVPVTVGHPKSGVSAETWKDLAVGEVGDDVLRDGEFVRVPMMLRDATAIKAVEDGTRELSMGYSAEVVMADGVTPKGEKFDAIMSSFKMNHVAIVSAARGGAELRIGDGADHWGASPVTSQTADERTSPMADALRKMLVDGLQVETTDAGAAAIEKLLGDKKALESKMVDAENAHKAAVSDAEKAHTAAIADKDKALATKDADLAKKDAEIDALKGKIVDGAALDKLVAARADLVAAAKVIAKDVKTDGLSDADIRKAVVIAKRGNDVKDKSEAYFDAAFEILAEDAKKALDADPFARVVSDGLVPTGDAQKGVSDAYSKMIADMHAGKTLETAK